MSLTNRAMLVTLNISMIGRTGVDKQATKDANSFLQATDKAGKYNKCKIHDDDIRNVIHAAETARKEHKAITRPWDDKKIRILPAVLIQEYLDKIRVCKQAFENEVSVIQNNWLNIVMLQKQRLKSGLFNVDDYPGIFHDGNGHYNVDPELDLDKYFVFKHSMYTIPDKSHVVLDIEDETLEEIRQQIEEDNRAKLAESRKKLLLQLYEPVAKMADILGNNKKVYSTLIPNIQAQIDILPKLNIENDPQLNSMIRECRLRLTGYSVGQIREDENLKDQMATDASAIKSKMEAYLSVN